MENFVFIFAINFHAPRAFIFAIFNFIHSIFNFHSRAARSDISSSLEFFVSACSLQFSVFSVGGMSIHRMATDKVINPHTRTD